MLVLDLAVPFLAGQAHATPISKGNADVDELYLSQGSIENNLSHLRKVRVNLCTWSSLKGIIHKCAL